MTSVWRGLLGRLTSSSSSSSSSSAKDSAGYSGEGLPVTVNVTPANPSPTAMSSSDFAVNFKENNKDPQKLSLMSILTSIVLGVGAAMLVLNYYHASTCIANSPDEQEAYINAIGRRLESIEKDITQNTGMLTKLVSSLQTQLIRLEQSSIESLTVEAQSQAIKIALQQATFPPPVMPDSIRYKYDSAITTEGGSESSKGWGDDKWGIGKEGESEGGVGSYASRFDDAYAGFGASSSEKKPGGDDKFVSSSNSRKETKFATLTDAEAVKLCTDMKTEFSVIPGVSWGNLPGDRQQEWLHYSCDYHLQS